VAGEGRRGGIEAGAPASAEGVSGAELASGATVTGGGAEATTAVVTGGDGEAEGRSPGPRMATNTARITSAAAAAATSHQIRVARGSDVTLVRTARKDPADSR
jgi:hypothetical protein